MSIHAHVRARDYGCGNGTMDPSGAPGCPADHPTRWGLDGAKRPLRATAETALPRMPPDSAVIFLSCVLEYVQDIELVWSELWRVSGGDLFLVNIEPHALVLHGLGYGEKAKRKIVNICGDKLTVRPL